jgi:hypothetical protein
VYKLFIAIISVICLTSILGCESELQRQQREAVEEEMRMNDEFRTKLDRIKDEGKLANLQDAKGILRIVSKLEELEFDARGVDPDLHDEYVSTKSRWNDNYLNLAKDKYNELVRAANEKVDIQEYDDAIAIMNKFPQELRERGFYGDKVDKFVEDIKAFQSAPEEAHNAIVQAEEFVKSGEYDKALEVCDSFFKTSGKVKGASVRIVINKHISILDRILDKLIDDGKYDEALDRMQYYMNVYGRGSEAHRSFLNEKAEYVDEKKAAAEK